MSRQVDLSPIPWVGPKCEVQEKHATVTQAWRGQELASQ